MEFNLTEEQKLLIKTTKSFVKNELLPHEGLLEKTDNLPKELYQEIKKKSQGVGLYACNMPTEYGGGGLSEDHETILQEEFFKGGIPRSPNSDIVLATLLVW